MIVAEANRIAVLNAASPRYGQCNRQAPQLFEQLACNVNFLLEGVREGYLFLKKRYPSLTPSQRKFALQACSSKSCGAYRLLLAARGKAALSATIRFASAPTIRCRSAHLVEVQTNLLLPTMHTVSIMRTAASEAMPLRQAIPGLIESEVERSYVRVMNRRQSDSEDRSKSNRLDIKQGRHLIRQALQFFELLACNGGGKGQGPLRSLGGPRGIFSHVREYPLWCRGAHAALPPALTREKVQPFRAILPSARRAESTCAPAGAKKEHPYGCSFSNR